MKPRWILAAFAVLLAGAMVAQAQQLWETREPDPFAPTVAAAGACDGIGDGIWNGCRGTGCHVCQEKLLGYDCYFQRHPDCILNTTCAGQFYSCDAACPAPTEADRCLTCDGIGDGIWNGCRGTGCHVCQEKLVGYDCYFQRHPQCILNTTCAGRFYSCDAACPPPTEADRCGGGCVTDACTSCTRPSMALDYDLDGVPDTLEYDLAHKFFPAALLQGFDDDLEESYFYLGRAIPYTVSAYPQVSVCNEAYECLEIRYGLAYRRDTGDTFLGIGAHLGDSEFYAVLVQRTASWSSAQSNPASWVMIRDFTAAHWGSSWADSSRQGAYGQCPPYCPAYDHDEFLCRSYSNYCGWIPGWCEGTYAADGTPCAFIYDEWDCFWAGGSCFWLPSYCIEFSRCYSGSAQSSYRTLYVSEGKHGTYHTKSECDGGGFFGADACPFNRYNLRGYKGALLQNIGSLNYHANFDTKIQHPDFCQLYDVWSGQKFGSSHTTDFKHHFTAGLGWVLP